MYLSDIASESYYSQSRGGRNADGGSTRDVDSIAGHGSARRSSHVYRTSPPAPPTSIPLDDNFDAYTSEVPTEWVVGDRRAENDRDESVSGYRNYVEEMERMLSGQMENAARAQERQRQQQRVHQEQTLTQMQTHDQHPTLRRSSVSVSEAVRGSPTRMTRRSLGSSMPPPQPLPPLPPPENARQVSGKKGQIELVQQRILEDTPLRTISLWRERVAQSSAGGSVYGQGHDVRSEADGPPRAHAHGHGHRRVASVPVAQDARLRRVVADHARYASSFDGGGAKHGNGSVRGTDNGKAGRASYERSEYMVSYQQATKGMPKPLFSPRSESAALPEELKTPSSLTVSKKYDRAPPSPTLRRHFPRKSQDRSDFMITYPQTPPHTGSQASSASPKPYGLNIGNGVTPMSPVHGSFREIQEGGSSQRVTSTSSVEIILSSCDPSLLHIAPILYELGIKRVDHLRAVARLSEATRNREVKEQALKRGVTVVEWAIFLDKLQSL
ncbi:hypothetical protein K466DRAFT_583654 [Polyporus arcularius HHB13444]|uniref:Uncharacterized protein n=1 Tax=Polyporus arcularius HHB13444 TaxID=1314778 RepID=A0A5C3PMI3_9APHY|nr:hypothetical protein K466DRAFT_583654 [Polyporus arcularius HHB13444]